MRQIGKSSVEQTARKNSQQTVKNAHKSHHTNLLSQQQKLVITFFKSNPLGQQLQKYDHGRVWFFLFDTSSVDT